MSEYLALWKDRISNWRCPPCVGRLLWPSRTAAMKSKNSFFRREKDLSSEPSLHSKTVWYDIHVKISSPYAYRCIRVSRKLDYIWVASFWNNDIKCLTVVIQEQEKQRSIDKKKEEVEKKGLERKKEEVDEVQKLHVKLKQEQQRWDKECLAREKQQVNLMPMFWVVLSSVSFCCSHLMTVWHYTKTYVVFSVVHSEASPISSSLPEAGTGIKISILYLRINNEVNRNSQTDHNLISPT